MSSTINAGATASIAVPAGQMITGRGPGLAVVIGGQPLVSLPLTAGDDWKIGPFTQARTVEITAGIGGVSYDVSAFVEPNRRPVVGGDGIVRDPKTGLPVDGVGSGNVRVNPPFGFKFPIALLPAVYMSGGSAWTTADPADYIDPACRTGIGYHVDPINGNDTTGTGIGAYDGDFSLAFKTVRKALATGNTAAAAFRIILPGGSTAPAVYDVNTLIGDGGSMALTQSCMIYAVGKYRAVLSTHSDPVSYASDQGTTYVASVPVASATYPIGRVLDMANLNASGFWSDLVLAASQAACRATPGSYWIDTGTTPHSVYVNRADGTAATPTNTRVTLKKSTPGASTTFGASKVLYLENLEFHGGPSSSGQVLFNPNNNTAILVGKNLGFRYSNSSSNSITVQSGKLVFIKDWDGYANSTDVFNVHDTTNTGTSAISVNGKTRDNGRAGHTSCNGFTCHDGVLGIEINSDHADNYGGNFAHVSVTVGANLVTQVWGVGGNYGASRGNPGAPTVLNDSVWSSSADIWLDSCKITASAIGNAVRVDKDQLPSRIGRVLTRNCVVSGAIAQQAGSIYGDY